MKTLLAVVCVIFLLSSCSKKFGCYEPKDRGIIHKPLHRY